MKLLPLFVYGTLKRGERNQSVWPDNQAIVYPATIANASLYDFGPYPCMVDGDEIVSGELWSVRERWFPDTIEALDQLEGYQQGGDDLYVRRIVDVRIGEKTMEAYAYFFNQPLTAQFRKIPPDKNGLVSWYGM